MSIITFTSDFGYTDHYAAAVKAKILSKNHIHKIVDISHGVGKFDISHAAHLINSVYNDFPKGTVHIVAVNSFDNIKEKSIAFKLNDHFFICSDNGFISLIDGKPTVVVNLLEKSEIKNTAFPAKDIYADAAVFLANAGNIYELGPEMTEYNEVMGWQPLINPNEISGVIIHIDDFGNAISNIKKENYMQIYAERKPTITFSKNTIHKISTRYADISEADIGAIFNSNNNLEIFLRKGNANELLGINNGTMVKISFQ
jgi:S-adenosyl-L-methionine hydrolase (adenosine-forming)